MNDKDWELFKKSVSPLKGKKKMFAMILGGANTNVEDMEEGSSSEEDEDDEPELLGSPSVSAPLERLVASALDAMSCAADRAVRHQVCSSPAPWCGWHPAAGSGASAAVRAASLFSQLPRPAWRLSLSCHAL